MFSEFSKVFVGSSADVIGDLICKKLRIERGKISIGKFSNGETSVELLVCIKLNIRQINFTFKKESVRLKTCYILQSFGNNINDTLMESLLIIHACKLAAASRIR